MFYMFIYVFIYVVCLCTFIYTLMNIYIYICLPELNIFTIHNLIYLNNSLSLSIYILFSPTNNIGCYRFADKVMRDFCK